MLGSADQSGSMTPFWADRDHRVGAPRTTAAVLIYHGHRDEIDREIALAGYFDQLPPTTPKHLVVGAWAHAFPDDTRGTTPWGRVDWDAMKLAWLDTYVKGEPEEQTGVDEWPTVQVQDSTGQWRAEPDWPNTSGEQGTLVLSAAGALGATQPSGTSRFVEGAFSEAPASRQAIGSNDGRVIFSTPPLTGELHVTGQPILDVWVQLDRPDAHLAARLDAYDAGGQRIPLATVMGFRSMQHLDPFVNGRFVQSEAKLPPINVPIRVPLRFDPTSIVVPEGGSLRLTVAGSLVPNTLTPSQPSGLGTIVTILHDCDYPSTLRFQTLKEAPDFLDVEEIGEDFPFEGTPAETRSSDGGGMASATICGA
jgi:predicted acyl esterase